MRPAAVRFVAWWVFGALAWIALAATLARPDVIAGVAAGLVVAMVARLRHRAGVMDFRVRLRWLVHLPRLPQQVLHDLVILAGALLHPSQVRSAFRALPFETGAGAATDVGRRGLLALAASLGPNTFVVGFDQERDLVLAHQLVVNEQVLPIPDGKYPPP